MPVGELWGVGEKTRDLLLRFGLVTVGDVAHTPLHILQRAVGAALGSHLHQLAWGADRRELVPRSTAEDPEKSMGANETFGRDTDDRDIISRELLRLSGQVTRRMRAGGVAGRTVTITVRFADFTTITRSKTIPEATDVTQEVHRAAMRLYDALGLQRARIRLVGVRVEGLVPRGSVHRQLVLGEREHGWSDADRAVDLRPVPVRGGRGPAGQPARRDDGAGIAPIRVKLRAPVNRISFPRYRTPGPLPRLARTGHDTGGPPAPSQEATVPLSEEELRLLEQMERALVEEDPKFASTLRGTTLRQSARRKAILAGVVFVGGIVVLMTGVISEQPVIGIVGFVVMLASATIGLTVIRGQRGVAAGDASRTTSAPGRGGFTVIEGGRAGKSRRQRGGHNQASFMDRMEERWRRRREDNGF